MPVGYLDLSIIPKTIHRYGETVSIKVYSGQTYSDYGDLDSATTTLTSVNAIFNTYGVNQSYIPEGQFGEIRFSFFFDKNQTGIDVDNVIIRANGEIWKINKAVNHCLSGNKVVQEAIVTNG